MTRVIGFGAGGHAKVVIEILQAMGGFDIVGLLDVNDRLRGSAVLKVPVLGGEDLVPSLAADGIHHAFIGVGGNASTLRRRLVFDRVEMQHLQLVTAIHPSAVISPSAVIAAGATIMAGAIVNADTTIGPNAIINTGAIVEHDNSIAAHVHVSTGVRLAGGVRIGEGAHIGIGASVRQNISIGRHALVGAGAVVVDDVSDNTVVVGVPARVLRRREESWPT